jgi:mannan endo-1,6-alpha-mannosidase
MKEVACEDGGNCDPDQQSFKAYMARWWGAASKLAPYASGPILNLLQTSAQAAISTCTGGTAGNQCGLKWTTKAFDGIQGIGEMMSALEVVQSLLQPQAANTLTSQTGGTSQGNPNAGGTQTTNQMVLNPITGADKAGAGILTAIALLTTFGGSFWMIKK